VLLIQDLWRWAGFTRAQPVRPLGNDVAFTVAQVVLLALFDLGGHLGTGTARSAWGAARRSGAGGSESASASRAVGAVCGVPSQNGRWLLSDFVTSCGAFQSLHYLVAATLGPAALGLGPSRLQPHGSGQRAPVRRLKLRAAGLGRAPAERGLAADRQGRAARHRLDRSRHCRLRTGGCRRHDFLLELVYGAQYKGIGSLVVLAALSHASFGFALGAGIGLTAARRTRVLFLIRLSSGAVLTTCFLILAGLIGVGGVGWTSLLGLLVFTGLMWTAYQAARRNAEASGSDSSSTQIVGSQQPRSDTGGARQGLSGGIERRLAREQRQRA
jgi:hypothetical protein